MPIHVELVTQERKVFDEPEADMVIIPGAEGEMGILPNHSPVLTAMGFGELVIRKGSAEERFAIYGGVVDIRPNKVVVLADLAESTFDIDMQRAEEAREKAMTAVQEGVSGDQNALRALRRAELAVKLSRKVRTSAPALRILTDEDMDE